jgi:mono/diheme cytochrome c family protein
MMRTLAFVSLWAFAAATISVPLIAASPEQVDRGQKSFQYWCATCHAPDAREGGRFLPGTASLKAKYHDEKPAALEERTDLTPEFTKAIIRHGVAGMPFFRKTEISDSQMEDIAAYLARNTK